MRLNFIHPGKPTQKTFVESFNGKFGDSCLNQHWLRSIDEARMISEAWRQDYNEDRPHSSLGYQPPAVFAREVPRNLSLGLVLNQGKGHNFSWGTFH